MSFVDFRNVDIHNGIHFKVDKKPNRYGGYTGRCSYLDGTPVTCIGPEDMSLPFAPEKGGLTVYEEVSIFDIPDDGSQDPDTADRDHMETEFYSFVKAFCKSARSSFKKYVDQKRRERDSIGARDDAFGRELFPEFEIAQHKTTPHADGRVFMSNKYSFKAHSVKTNDRKEIYQIDVRDEFNGIANLHPQTGQRGQLLIHLHSWYYDSDKKKFHVRIYVKAVVLKVEGDLRKDIRSFFETKLNPYVARTA